MGTTGAKRTGAADDAASEFLDALSAQLPVSSKSMFGGHGIFSEDVMFGLVDSSGQCFLRTNEETAADYDPERRHGRMPYHAVPDEALADADRLAALAAAALDVARANRK